MSLKLVPVCASCGRSTEVSISCTICCQICCATCLNIRSDIFSGAAAAAETDQAAERSCPKCISSRKEDAAKIKDSVVVKTELAELVDHQSSATDSGRGLCALHHKECKLFCTQCSVAICGLCIDEGQAHELHHIDNFSIVYREKVSEFNSKLDQAKKSVEALGTQTAICGWNLELLENEEAAVLKEIDAVSESSKLKVTRQTSIRKERLRAQLQIPVKRERAVAETRNLMQGYSVEDFMRNLPKLDKICTTLATTQVTNDIPLETADDIACDLVPAYRFGRFTLLGLFQQEDYSDTSTLITAFDVVWTITIVKSAKLQAKISPNDPEVWKFPHKLLVIIPHSDSAKEIRQTFDLKDNSTVFDIVEMSYLIAQGFNQDENLVVKMGFRPLNSVIDNRLLVYQYEQVKAKHKTAELNLLNAEKKLASITGRMDYNHLVMHYTVKKIHFKKNWDLSSYQIMDGADRRWRLNLFPANDIGAYIELVNGDATHGTYFVELMHQDPAKNVVGSSPASVYMDVGVDYGWDCFIKWKDLIGDVGFYSDGILRFRFGVRPLPA